MFIYFEKVLHLITSLKSTLTDESPTLCYGPAFHTLQRENLLRPIEMVIIGTYGWIQFHRYPCRMTKSALLGSVHVYVAISYSPHVGSILFGFQTSLGIVQNTDTFDWMLHTKPNIPKFKLQSSLDLRHLYFRHLLCFKLLVYRRK